MTNLYPDKNINYSSKIITSYPRVTINKNEVIDPSDKKGAFTVPFPNNSSDSNLIITLNSKRDEYIHQKIYVNRLLHFNIDKITTDNENIVGELVIEHKNLTKTGKVYTCYLLESTPSFKTDGNDIDKMLTLPDTEFTNMDITLNSILPTNSDCIVYNTNNNVDTVCVFTSPIVINTESTSKIMKYADKTTLFEISATNKEAFNGYREGLENANTAQTTIVATNNSQSESNEIYIDCNPTGVGEDEMLTYTVPINSKMMDEEQESQLMKTTVNYGMFLIALVVSYVLVPVGYKSVVIDPINLVKIQLDNGPLNRIRSVDILISLIYAVIIITLFSLDSTSHKYAKSSALFIGVFYLLSFGLVQLKKLQSEFMTTLTSNAPIVTLYPDETESDTLGQVDAPESFHVSDFAELISKIVVFLIAHGVKPLALVTVTMIIVSILILLGIVEHFGYVGWVSLIAVPVVYIIEFAKHISDIKKTK
jgi:hypothetical protein